MSEYPQVSRHRHSHEHKAGASVKSITLVLSSTLEYLDKGDCPGTCSFGLKASAAQPRAL